ncbi:Alkali metal cation/H+ antiporter Nha1 C terminus family protein [Candida albicans]|nr:Alkali metal cation/H+ antiporter Nha1 C terminus family protein [Candida albicans]
MAITMSFTTDQEGNGSGGWMQRLQKLDRATTSFSLHRVDTMAPTEKSQPETTGTKVRGNKTPEPESASDTLAIPNKTSGLSAFGEKPPTKAEKAPVPTVAYQDGDQVIIEDQYGEVMENLKLTTKPVRAPDIGSIHSMESLERHLTQYSTGSGEYTTDEDTHGLQEKLSRSLSRRSYYKKDDPNKRKVYAHRVDDLIVIENEDGDIIRRYKVNKHAPAPRARSGSIMGMVKSMVGIKPPPEISVTDLEHGTQHKIILPEEENTPMSSKTEQKLEDTIANILQENHTQPISEESADEESADEEETEVEKKRRLQALGYLPSSRRDREDEEE